MNKSLVTGVVIGAAVVSAGAAVANFAFDRKPEAMVEAPASQLVVPEAVEAVPEPVVEEVPVICGVHATDPRRRMWHWLGRVTEMGFSAVLLMRWSW